MDIFTKLIKRFTYVILCCFLTSFPSFANLLLDKPNVAGIPPEAIDVKNFYLQSINEPFQILPLIGKDPDGFIVSFKIISKPPANPQGRLMLNNVEVTNGQILTPSEAKGLKFEPRSGFKGIASFTYTVIDNEGLSDGTPAIFTIPVTNNTSLLVCSGTGLGTNILGSSGTFSTPYITPNNSVNNCINNGSTTAGPIGNLGNAKPLQTTYTYASTSGGLGPEGTYSFLKTLGTISPTDRNCIKTDWVASDHTGDGGYAMIVNGSPNSASFGKTFYQATSITVCPNTLYEFSAYVINVLPGNHPAAAAGTEPNISFYINGQLVSTSGPIAYADASLNYVPQWVKVGGLWYSGPNTTNVDLRIDNATFVAGGNDLGLDDISLAICGPDISYPDIDLTAKFCSYGTLPLKADVKASVNTYSAYIFQNSIDGGLTWTDMGTAKIGSPVYNAVLNTYEYTAEYGDIPIIPSMDGYRYRLKVATDINNLIGTNCNISADKVITVSTFNMPAAGADITGCNPSTTAKLVAAGPDETWNTVAGNPAPAMIDQLGNVTGMTVNGIYRFRLSNNAGCSDTINVTRDQIKSAGADITVCGLDTFYKLDDAGTGYKWESVPGNPAAATIDAATGAINGLTIDGVYHFILRSDYGNCTDEILVTKSAISLSYTKTDVLCFGSSTGSIDLEVTGGISPYIYAWNGGITSQDLTNLLAGTYDVTVTDSKGCTATVSVNITQPASALTLSSTQTNVNCFGESTGAIDLTISGGTAPYTYSWSSGQSTEDLTGLVSGTYTGTVTDSKGCTASVSVNITQPASALTLSSTHTNVNCFGESTGAIDLTVTGGTAPYTYNWSSGQSTEDLSGLPAGTYTVTVTDSKGCTATVSVNITQPASALTLSSTHTNVNCFGESTGAIDLTVTGGTAPYTYNWSSGQSTEDLSGLPSGTYTVTVTDSKGCTATVSVNITQPASALTLSSTHTNVNCFGESTGAIDLTVSGGTAPYTYSWSSGQSTEDLNGLPSGTYTVTVRDSKGCTATVSVNITQPASALTLSSTQTNVNCFGESTGAIDLTVTGGTAPYTYTWSSGQSTEDLTGLVSGTYSVTVRDSKGCTATVSVNITQPASALTLSSTQTNVNCFGESTGAIDLTVSGGTAPYTYSWSSGQSTEDLSGLPSGTYTVTVTDSKGCTATVSVNITQPASALTLSSTHTNVNCFGESTAAIDLTVTGGTAPYTYSWSSGQSTEDLTGLVSGTYTVTVTDSKGCTATVSVNITQPASALTLSSTQTNVNCFGESTGAIDLTVSGGTAPYTYSWSSGQSTEDLSGLPSGTYSVTVTDSKGCTATVSVNITQPASALTLSSTHTNVNCFGESTGVIDLTVTGGTAPYTYNWSSGQSTEDLSGLSAGTYTVKVTDMNSCTQQLKVKIEQPELITIAFTVRNATCLNSEDGYLLASVTGGVSPYTLVWNENKNLNSPEIKNAKSGKYSLLITDANGCSIKAESEILYGNCFPVALDDSFRTEQHLPFIGHVAPNDSDPNNEKLTFLKLSDPENGKIVFNQDGKFSFQPDSGFNGQTDFSYQICNVSGNCQTAKVRITVTPISLVSLTPEISSVKEGDKVSITARLRQVFPEDVFITLEYSGKADKEKDYLVLDNYQGLKIPKGSFSTTDKVTLAVVNDAFEEGNEDIIIKIKSVSNPAVKIGNGALVLINDVYPPPPIKDVPGVEIVNDDIVIDPLLSPNDDGIGNEYFTIRNIENYPDNEVIVFNRWGNELFYMKGYNSTDRTFKGYANKGMLVNSDAPLADGVYFYIVNTFVIKDGVRTKNMNRGYLILKR